jgi:ABC-type branched-subunit amino acid transport system ATPase component
VGVIGPNGSGKTTFFNALTGLYAAAAGDIRFEGRNLVGLDPHVISRLGMARTFQASRLCLGLSVFDNVLIGMHARRRSGLVDLVLRRARFLAEIRDAIERAAHLLALFNRELPARGFEPVGQLPQIDRRRVEICRALASEPRLLLLDEPSAGMSPEETAELMKDLQIVREEMPGLSVIIIEHDMFVIEGVSRRVVAFNYGRKIAEGSFAAVAANAEVREAYLGRETARA